MSSPDARLTSSGEATEGRLFVLDISGGLIFSMRSDGSGREVIVTGCRHPDGISVDVASPLGRRRFSSGSSGGRFSGDEIDGLRADGAIPHAQHLEAAGTQHQVRNRR